MKTFPNGDQTWRPGQSGNRRGRPRGRGLKAVLGYLAATLRRLDDRTHGALADALAQRVIADALKGNLAAMRLLMDAERDAEADGYEYELLDVDLDPALDDVVRSLDADLVALDDVDLTCSAPVPDATTTEGAAGRSAG